ncbi:MAG: glycosyltransferase family 2 protein [Candidatus Zhuqueibacterota bacterium]
MKLSIIIVNWNTRELLKKCLESVMQETRTSYEVFVVDNASPDGSAGMVRADFPTVQLIANTTNRGFAAANNQAIHLARGEYVLLLNPDTKVLDRAIDTLVAYLDSAPEVGAVTSKLLNGDGSLQKNVGNFYSFWATLLENRIFPTLFPNSAFLAKRFVAFWDHASLREIDWARGAVMMVRRKVIEQIRLLDEQFYIYGEEVDWCWRIKKAGWKIMYLPEARIIHYGKAASSQRKIEMFIQNYKSAFIFLKKSYPLYSYWLYRLRTTFYSALWLIRYGLPSLVAPKDTKRYAELKSGFDVYAKFFFWNLSRKSWITVMTQEARLDGQSIAEEVLLEKVHALK